MFRRLTALSLSLVVLVCSELVSISAAAGPGDKNFTAEQLAESVIAYYGGKQALSQIRRNGIERGKMTRPGADGRVEESSYERRFVRGENLAKDKIRIDQKMSSAEYALVYGEGRTWGMINGSSFTPRQDAAEGFLDQMWHGVDALLRYKEDGSTLTYVGKDKQKNIDMYVLDLVDKEKHRTRYYISARTLHVLSLEYESPAAEGVKPVKYTRKFYDYRLAQGTLVPYRTVLYQDGKQIQETRVSTVTYGVKLEDALFQNPEAQNTAAQTQPPG